MTRAARQSAAGLGATVAILFVLPVVYTALYTLARSRGDLTRNTHAFVPPDGELDYLQIRLRVYSSRPGFWGDVVEAVFWPLARAEESFGARKEEKDSMRSLIESRPKLR